MAKFCGHKTCLEKYKDCGVNDTAEKYMECTPQISQIPVMPDEPEPVITGMNTADKSLHFILKTPRRPGIDRDGAFLYPQMQFKGGILGKTGNTRAQNALEKLRRWCVGKYGIGS